MTNFKIPSDTFYLSIENNRHVNVTPPWFSGKSKYPPRANNVIEPLINGERAFGAVHEAISKAKKSVCIVSWGFDPSMRLLRPSGERIGELMHQKSEKDFVQFRILIWKDALANFQENNIIGDALLGSGGNTALGSGIGGQTSAGGGSNAKNEGDFNGYADKKSNSAAVARDDDAAKKFNRDWFNYHHPNIDFRTRGFSPLDSAKIYGHQLSQHGSNSLKRTMVMGEFPSHHQKMILIDYELPDEAVGFVMGHNLLRDYWDTDAHEYHSPVRHGFSPWHDLSCRVRGPVLWDLNENFSKAWDKAKGWLDEARTTFDPVRETLKPDAFVPAALKRGKGEMAQIIRTQPQEDDRSILDNYRIALSNARNYVYFENQYFRYKEFAELMRTNRRKLKAAGWKRDFYLFVVTNVPDDSGRMHTYEMLRSLGKASVMPAIEKKEDNGDADKRDVLRKIDLEGVHIHLCTLAACAQTPKGVQYKNIYVHSKLLLVDDVFFTLGSANVNARSMEGDSELNIACPSPELTKQFREHLWKIHTKESSSDDMGQEFKRWRELMNRNKKNMNSGQPLIAPLLEFHDEAKSRGRAD
jgi:phosphatidylserine/phosphatidylglycerophosphate/cardiolipin synthase-like enzyme